MSTNTIEISHPTLLSTFSPEMQFLLCCARVEMVEPFRAYIEQLMMGEIAWDKLMPLAARHGMVALLHKHLVESGHSNVPSEFMKRLNIENRRLRAQHLFLTAQTLKVSKLLSGHNIPHLHYKGVVLDQLLYGGHSLRPSGDMDILVPESQVHTVRDLLLAQGYTPKLAMHKHQEQIILQRYKDYGFVHSQHNHTVEVHWKLMSDEFGGKFDYNYFNGRQQIVHVNQQPLATFALPDMYLTLACHGALHRYECLKWLIDINEIATRYPSIDWLGIRQEAINEKLETIYLLSLNLCQNLCGSTINHGNWKDIRKQKSIKALRTEVCNIISDNPDYRYGFDRFSFYVRAIDGFEAKVKFIFMMLFRRSVRDMKSDELPNLLTPFYYIMRVIRLARREGISALLRTLGRMVRAIKD